MPVPPNQPCPCGSGRKSKRCCRPFLQGAAAPTPESLMRSRYTAYASGDAAYLIATTDPAGPHWRPRPDAWRRELEDYFARAEFTGLTVLGTGVHGALPTVTFEARLRLDGIEQVLAERSRFRQLAGRWVYTDAI